MAFADGHTTMPLNNHNRILTDEKILVLAHDKQVMPVVWSGNAFAHLGQTHNQRSMP